MSRLSLTTNVASLNAQRNLTQTSKNLETSFSRLSSGMRINRASDDAAGLSVSSLLNMDKVVLTQGIRNLNDGISYLNIAEGAITELTNIMFRIQEISEQSANGTLSNTQRKPLQDEVSALQNEYNRIIKSTKFNGMQLLTGANTLVNLQGGYRAAGGLAVQVGNALLNDAFGLYSAGETIRVSTSSSGGQSNGQNTMGSVSADGRFLSFRSNSTNLISGVSGEQAYVKNLETGELVLASSTSDGVQGNGYSSQGSLSADGRYMVFFSNSSNLLPGVSGDNIYVKDLQTGELHLASSNEDGVQGNGLSAGGNISADGRYVAFRSHSTNFLPGVNSGQIYVKDLHTGKLHLASSTQDGVQGNDSSNSGTTLSADGRYLLFRSFATNLLPGVGTDQLYMKDLHTGALQLVSGNQSGVQGNGDNNGTGTLSADGRYIAFASDSTNLLTGVSGWQIYVKDVQTGELRLGSSNKDGIQGSGNSYLYSLSADGRYLSIAGNANFTAGVSGWQIYRKDLLTGEMELVSRSADGAADANNGASPPIKASFISADGSKVFFHTDSSNLIAGDTNGLSDIFMRDLSKTGVDELAGMVVSNQTSARVTLALSKQRLETLNLARSGIGASSSRIDTAISNLSTITQNLASAASQIIDTDVAEESARLVTNQILQQSGAAVLAQANLQTELVLTLLQDI